VPTSGFPGSPPNLLKGGFLHFAAPNAAPTILAFPYNPETLCRTLVPASSAAAAGTAVPAAGILGTSGSSASAAAGSATPAGADPVETIVFTLALDATDQLELGSAQAADTGVYPLLSAIELLMYPQSLTATSTLLFAWGPNRIVPVRITSLKILERLFDPNLSPIQALVEVTLVVTAATALKDGRDSLQSYVANLNSLATSAYTASLATLGIAVS
jgi:hypothetical protein